MRFFAMAALVLWAVGCAPQQSNIASQVASAPVAAPSGKASSTTASAAPAQPLPFKGRLADGDPSELPPSVALSLSNSSAVVFSYREELTHDEYHIPLWVSWIDPVTYFGSPLGDYGVSAFASLSITEGDRVLGDYTAKVHVSKSYNLYHEPTHQELEQAARTAVRAKIDQKLRQDADRLAQEIAAANISANGTSSR